MDVIPVNTCLMKKLWTVLRYFKMCICVYVPVFMLVLKYCGYVRLCACLCAGIRFVLACLCDGVANSKVDNYLLHFSDLCTTKTVILALVGVKSYIVCHSVGKRPNMDCCCSSLTLSITRKFILTH